MKAAGYDYDTSGELSRIERLDIPIYLSPGESHAARPCCDFGSAVCGLRSLDGCVDAVYKLLGKKMQ